MHTRSHSALVISLLVGVGLVGCSGGSSLGGATEGSGTSSSAEGSCGTSNGSNGSSGSNAYGDAPASGAPSSTPDEPPTPPSTPSGGSTGPRPECVAFANHQCACNGSHATANCTTTLADGCESGAQTCPGQLAWYNCVTANACGTNACVGLGKGC